MKTLAFLAPVILVASINALLGQATLPDYKNQSHSPGIAFMPNLGQVAYTNYTPVQDIDYASAGNPLQLFLRRGPEFSFVSRLVHEDTTVQDTAYRVDMHFIGEGTTGNASAQPLNPTDWYHNYYLPQCPEGITGLHGYHYLIYEEVYPLIDVHVTSNAWGYKFYFVVWPGGDPSEITMLFTGQDELDVDVEGGLRMLLQDRWVRLPQAIAYQLDGGNTIAVPWSVDYFESLPDMKVTMVFGEYDDTKPLVFDISEDTPMGGTPPLPSPEWGTYYNGVGAAVLNAARTTSGGLVTCGTSSSSLFPLTNGVLAEPLGGKDAFYSRFTDQYHMLYTTYIGGIHTDVAYGVAERNGFVVVTGTTKNAGGIDFDAPSGGFMDDEEGTEPGNNWGASDGTCWLARFNPVGVRDWMTLFGPKYALKPVNVDFDQSGNVYLAGTVIWQLGMAPLPVEFTNSPTFNSLSICGGGYSQSTMGYAYWSPSPPDWTDGFLAKFTSALALERSTLFGGSSRLDHITDMEVERDDGTMFIVGNTLSPLGTDPLCGPADGNTPGFPWCPSVLPDAFFMANTPPDNHYEGVENRVSRDDQEHRTIALLYLTRLCG